jgi:hypothetical protein
MRNVKNSLVHGSGLNSKGDFHILTTKVHVTIHNILYPLLVIENTRETPTTNLKGLTREGNGRPGQIVNLIRSGKNGTHILTLQVLGKVKEGRGRNHFLLEHFRFNNLFILG